MIATPLITRPVAPRVQAAAQRAAAEGDSPIDGRTLEARIDASVDGALAEALAKVKTPADDELAKQQAAFDRMMQLRTEQEREANAIREFGMVQQKKENDFLQEFIRMI